MYEFKRFLLRVFSRRSSSTVFIRVVSYSAGNLRVTLLFYANHPIIAILFVCSLPMLPQSGPVLFQRIKHNNISGTFKTTTLETSQSITEKVLDPTVQEGATSTTYGIT